MDLIEEVIDAYGRFCNYEVCSKNTRTVLISRLELVSGESAWCR